MPTISPFVGTIACRECGNEEQDGKLMDVDDYGDRTLLWCTSCQAWVKWYGGHEE